MDGAFAINVEAKWNSIQDGTWEPIEEGGFTMDEPWDQYTREIQDEYERVQTKRREINQQRCKELCAKNFNTCLAWSCNPRTGEITNRGRKKCERERLKCENNCKKNF